MKFATKNTPIALIQAKLFLPTLLAFCLISSPSFGGTADPQSSAILMKARAYIGEESALKNVRSMRYVGTITNKDGEKGKVEIFIRDPYQQLQIVTFNDTVSEFGLDDYIAWRKVYKVGNPDMYALHPATAGELRRTRANAFENLNFFSNETNYSRKIDYLGKDTFEGNAVEKVKIRYGDVFFIRFFDVTTGELLYSEIESGEGIRESGEVIIDGIKLPKAVTNFQNGEQVSYVEFETIEVNPVIDDSLFIQPPLPGLKTR